MMRAHISWRASGVSAGSCGLRCASKSFTTRCSRSISRIEVSTVHGPLPYVVLVHAQGSASLILRCQATQTALRGYHVSGAAEIILTPFA